MKISELEKLTRKELNSGYDKVCLQRGDMQTSLDWLGRVKDKIDPEVYNRMIKDYGVIINQLTKDSRVYLDAMSSRGRS